MRQTFILFVLLAKLYVGAQNFDIYDERILLKDHNYKLKQSNKNNFSDIVKTVKLTNTTNELLDPVILLGSSEKLELSVDILGSDIKSLAYTFIHCDSNWNITKINQFEYLDGFNHNYINDYQTSFNTLIDYTHYSVNFPNENVNFIKSGNYVILIYDYELDEPVATKRFMVYENILDIKTIVKKSNLAKNRFDKQIVEFTVQNHFQNQIENPHSDLRIIVQQNDDWNSTKKDIKPSFINNKIIEFNNLDDFAFMGGYEFNDFDLKSVRYFGKNIKNIKRTMVNKSDMILFELFDDYVFKSTHYDFRYDLNGKYVTSVSENKNKNNEAEYVIVEFKLTSEKIDEDIYLFGELTNWDIIEEAKLNYDYDSKRYVGRLLLKQGYYNYKYVLLNNNNVIENLDNNFHETRNQYSIYVYYKPIWQDYESLIGVAKNNSNSLN